MLVMAAHILNHDVCESFDSTRQHFNGLKLFISFLCAASNRSLSRLRLLSRPFNPSWATPLLPLHCNVNAALSVQGTNMPGTMGV